MKAAKVYTKLIYGLELSTFNLCGHNFVFCFFFHFLLGPMENSNGKGFFSTVMAGMAR
jgi:hypothetical protein